MSLYAQRSTNGFYDAWESLSPAERELQRRDLLTSYLRYAGNLPFYRDRVREADLDSDSPLVKVPPLNSAELRDLVPPASRAIVCGEGGGYSVFQSGGTTGVPKSTLFGHEELDRLNLPNARGFFALGLTPEDRVGNLFAVGSLYMTFVHTNRMLQQYGCTNFPFANNTAVDFVHTVVKLFDINCLTGIASIVMANLRGMEKLGLEGVRIKKVFYGGEHLYEADKKELRDRYGVEQIAAPGYGTVDTWYLGYQCSQAPGGVFHAHDDQVYLEIVDEETGKLCVGNQPGMVYATAFERRVTPIVRYRVGDRAQWLGENCLCGRTTPLFRLLGRGDDVLRIGYDSIDYAAVQEVALGVAGLSGTIQMEKQRREGRDELIVRIESASPAEEFSRLADVFGERFLEARPPFRDFIAKKLTWPLRTEVLKLGTLPTNPRTGKLIRVVDQQGDA